MAAVHSAPNDRSVAPRWGLGDALGGWLLAYSTAVLFGGLILAAFGYRGSSGEDLPLTMIALQYPPLWLGFVGVPVWAAATKGYGVVPDFRARIKAVDLFGIGAGVLAQFVLVPLVSWPVLWLTNTDVEKLGEPARRLSEKATSPGGIALFMLIVVIGAPIAEELFFRGLVLRSFEKRFGTVWAVIGSSVVFGATHFQLLQFPALTAAGLVFALVVVRTNRLGAGVMAHMGFNAVTAISLVWFT